MDGSVMGENLSRLDRDRNWLVEELKKQGYRDAKEIFLAIYHPDGNKLRLYPNN